MISGEKALEILIWLIRSHEPTATRQQVSDMHHVSLEAVGSHPWFHALTDDLLTISEAGRRRLRSLPHGGKRPPRAAKRPDPFAHVREILARHSYSQYPEACS